MNASTDSSSWISLAEASWPTFDDHDNGDKTKPKPTSIEESYTNQTSWPRRVLKGAKLEVVSLCPTPVLLKTNTCDWWAVMKVHGEWERWQQRWWFNGNLDSAGGVAFRETLQMFGMFGVWLKSHRTNLLEDENRSELNINARNILFAWFFLSSGSPKYFV